jgi:hypothetical protein
MRVRGSLQLVVAVCLWGAAMGVQGEPIAVIGSRCLSGPGPRANSSPSERFSMLPRAALDPFGMMVQPQGQGRTI